MDESLQQSADLRFMEALEARGARDPREFYRESLRELKASDPDAYGKAVHHYRETLIPSIARGDAEPLLAWLEYGRLLAALTAEGRTILVDGAGRTSPWSPDTALDALVLHLPNDRKRRAVLVGLPAEPSPAQKATFDLLVQGRQKLPGA